MKKLNQRGFSAFEITLLILVLAALGFAGFTVWQKNKPDEQVSTTVVSQKTAEQEPVDKTSSWLLYENATKDFSVRFADGWELTKSNESEFLYASPSKLGIVTGKPAKVSPSQSGRDYDTIFFLRYGQGGSNIRGEKQTSLTTTQGVEIVKHKYYKTTPTDGLGTPQGGTEYHYLISKNNKIVYIFYSFGPDQTDYHLNVEKVAKTVHLN